MHYRAALIGCGRIGSQFADDPKMKGDIFTHAEAYTRCPATELVALCDTDAERLAACGKRWNVQALYASVEEMLQAERVDVVSVCTPDATHYEVIRRLLNGNWGLKGVLCEKPFVLAVPQAQELIRFASENGVVLAVMYLRRHAQNMRALSSLLASGALGEIQGVSGWYTKGVLHNGSHWFDLLRYLVCNVEWVVAWNRLADDATDPTLDVMLRLENGAFASLRACDSRQFSVFEMDLMGTQGRVQLTDSGYRIDYHLATDSPRYTGCRELVRVFHEFGDRCDVMLHAVSDLVAAIEDRRAPSCDGADGLAALAIGRAALLSAENGRRVCLKELLGRT